MMKHARHSSDYQQTRSGRAATRLSPRLDGRLASYALAAGAAGVGVLSLAQPSKADIIYSHANVSIGPNSEFSLRLTRNGPADFTFSNSYGVRTNGGFVSARGHLQVGGNLPNASVIFARSGSNDYAAALARGARIGPDGQFTRGIGIGNAAFCGGCYPEQFFDYGSFLNTRAYLGLRFPIGGQEHYGWANLSVSTGGEFDSQIAATLSGYAYNTVPNQPIFAGQVPEPGTLGLLALGSLGIAAWRRKKAVTSDQ
jgi:hypothetical protein